MLKITPQNGQSEPTDLCVSGRLDTLLSVDRYQGGERVSLCWRGLGPFSLAVQEAEVRAGHARARNDIITPACQRLPARAGFPQQHGKEIQRWLLKARRWRMKEKERILEENTLCQQGYSADCQRRPLTPTAVRMWPVTHNGGDSMMAVLNLQLRTIKQRPTQVEWCNVYSVTHSESPVCLEICS